MHLQPLTVLGAVVAPKSCPEISDQIKDGSGLVGIY